jgi:hypothetical protein
MMNETYIFKFKKRVFWKSIRVMGHKFDKDQNKMLLFLPNGGLREIANWAQCECKLDIDWVLITKQQIKEEAGQ